MPTFITYASYSTEGARGLMQKPEDRRPVIQSMLDTVGGKVIALYMVTGSNDIVLISEAPDGDDVAAVAMAVAASGTLSKVETVRAWASEDFAGIAAKAAKIAGSYKAPGK
ncbi:GYD domain-containing protein [Pseudoruegeria sp. SHC-113]|uniref:GYD domain-containing protein n=1 Tax=Pseudoruegeria sp. SHC-113 TaxID=2855439 RepID=UPI0021BA8FD0|nr:GYD domain-containing protein [Pseudoruegeria sp. SHC-113]MCT8161001.1 GYD domain-containing protein [Pseudoruegeria sp. SHC-113]